MAKPMSQIKNRLEADTIEFLRRAIRGRVVTPADAVYNDARKIWNGLVDRHPGAIAYCTRVEDVAACVRFAREREILTAVRSGGHACAGTALCDGGLVIDISSMRTVRVDPARRIALAQAGAHWNEVDVATRVFDLATPGGTDSEVGIAGLTLGGGNGWLMGTHGATCDNVNALEAVTADGAVVRATVSENP